MTENTTDKTNEQTAERLAQIGREILGICRDELYFSMRFLDVALSSFVYTMDPGGEPFRDGRVSYVFSPTGSSEGLYRENRILANRGYLHMVLHCIFRHIWKTGGDRGSAYGSAENGPESGKRLWNLSCDIAVEHIIDGCDLRPVRFSRSLLRRETYRKLELSGHVLNAQRVCRLLTEWELTEKELGLLEEEFRVDDHRYWENENRKQPQNQQMQQKWKDIDEKMETDLETFSKEAAEKNGSFLGGLRV